MKYSRCLTIVLSMTLLQSCDFSKNNSPNHSTDGRSVSENEVITNTTNYKKSGNFDAMDEVSIATDKITDSLNENWNLDNPERRKNLYSRFNMSEAQIQRYEAAIQKWKEKEQNDAYKLLSANEKIKEENQILKTILDESQYKQYIQWSKANDLRN